jgi:transposase
MKTEVNEYLKNQSDKLNLGRSESISKFAKDFKCTIATVYRWIKSGDYYVMNGEIYKQVK